MNIQEKQRRLALLAKDKNLLKSSKKNKLQPRTISRSKVKIRGEKNFRQRSRRCGECAGCMRQSCGDCSYCKPVP